MSIDPHLRLTIEGVLGVIYADIPIAAGHITEVLGPNASGKTSVATCAQAVLSHRVNPLGLTAADAKRCYPNDGTDPADSRAVLDVSLLDDETGEPMAWDVIWRPASQSVTAPATEPLSRPEAVGLVDWRARRDAKERATALQSALLPHPDIVMRAIADKLAKYLDADDIAGVLEMLTERGWEPAEAIYAERARAAKRDWRQITGETWGSAKAADWRPAEWHTDWDRLSPTAATDLLNTARENHEALLRVAAITEAEAEAAAEATAKAKALTGDIEAAEAAVRQLQADMAAIGGDNSRLALLKAQDDQHDAEGILASLKVRLETAKTDPSLPCPHCGGPLVVSGMIEISPYDPDANAETIAALEIEIAAAKKSVTAAKAKVRKAETAIERRAEKQQPLAAELETVERKLAALRADQNHFARLGAVSGTVVGVDHGLAIAAAEQDVEDARTRRDAVDAAHRAAHIHESVVRYSDVAKALGAQGVRATMLDDGLRRLSRALARIAAITGWPEVTVAATGSVVVGDRPVPMCSESEQWRAQAAIQLALAVITDSKVVVLDRADLLDGDNRVRLSEALARILTGCPWLAVLVCATGEHAYLTVHADVVSHRVWLRGGQSIVEAEIVEDDRPEEETS